MFPRKFRTQTTNADAPFGRMNGAGLVLPLEISTHDQHFSRFEIFDQEPLGPVYGVTIERWPEVQTDHGDYTVKISVYMSQLIYYSLGELYLLFPYAIQPWTIPIFPPDPGWPDPFPDPITITPLPWWIPDDEAYPIPP